jgi:hypothetical protein
VLIGIRGHAAGDRVEAELELQGNDAVVVALDPTTPPELTAA